MPKSTIGGTPTNRTKTMETGRDADIMMAPKKPKSEVASVKAMLAAGRPNSRSSEIDR